MHEYKSDVRKEKTSLIGRCQENDDLRRFLNVNYCLSEKIS